MRIYWTLHSIPEVADLGPRARRAVFRAVMARAIGRADTWLALVLGFVMCGATSVLGIEFCIRIGVWLNRYAGLHMEPTWWVVFGGAMGGGLGGLLFSQLIVHSMRRSVRVYLDEQGFPPDSL